VVAFSLALTACGGTHPNIPLSEPAQVSRSAAGVVTVEVTWAGPSGGLVFAVAMNTHQVDLSRYDLGSLAELRPDTGITVHPSSWRVLGGADIGRTHHLSGRLTFPDRTPDGRPVLGNGVHALTLVLRNVGGVPERTFEWKR
jgi:hypothetical protein